MVGVGLCLWGAVPEAATGLQLFPAAEIQEAHALRQRILAEVPQLDPRLLRERPRLPPEVIALVRERLTALQAREADNPFLHWAHGELLREVEGPAAAAPAFERARQAAGPRPLVHWLLWQDYLDRNLREEAQREEHALQAIQLKWGLTRFPLLAAEQMRRGDEAAEAGDLRRAVALYDAAIANVPESPEARLGRAALTWRMDKTRLLTVMRDLIGGLSYTLRAGQTGFRLTSNLLLSLIVAWLAALALVAAILAVKIHPLFIHDLSEWFLKGLPPPAQVRLGVLVLFLPLVLGLGLLWAAIGVLVVGAPYMSRREQWLASVLLVFLLALPIGYDRVAARHVLASSRNLALVQTAEEGGRGDGLLRELNRWAQEAPTAGLPRYYLGLVLKRRGDLIQSEKEMTQAAQLLPREGFVQIGLGNVQYLRGQLHEAEATYRRAAELMPSSAAVQVDLSKLYTQRLQLDPSNEALTKSLRLDPQMVRTVSSFHEQGMIDFVVDEQAPWNTVAAALAPSTGEVRPVAEGLWGSPLRGVSLRLLPFAAVASLLLLWTHVILRGRTSPVRRCQQCRAVFCGKCQSDPREKEYCAPCAAVFRQRERVAAFVKVRRIREGEEWLQGERLRIGLLGSLVPGGSDLYRGRVIRGLLLVLFAAWLLVEGIVLDLVTPSLRFASPLPGPIRWTAVLLLLLMLCAYSIHRSWNTPTVEGG
jgi:tetratricopeptide (TPR) repeat protein